MATNYLMRIIFGTFDIMRLFRKSRRYTVDLALNVKSVDGEQLSCGRVLNLSQTGCMIRVKADLPDQKEALLEIDIPCRARLGKVHVVAEHLWSTNIDGDCFHGLRFMAFVAGDDEACLVNYLEQMAARQEFGQEFAT